MANAQRYYPPEPRTLTEAHEHLKQLTDNTYDLRERMDNLQKSHEELKAQQAKPQPAPALPYSDNVLGIKVKATTDPPSLQNGQTIRYNSATGAFEFGV